MFDGLFSDTLKQVDYLTVLLPKVLKIIPTSAMKISNHPLSNFLPKKHAIFVE